MQNPVYHFHILRSARDLYQVEEDLFHISGNVVFANFYQARALAQAMNTMRDTLRFPETAVKAGHINAMGLIDEVLHFVMGLYKEQEAADVMGTALGYLEHKFNNTNIDEVLLKFVSLYPPPAVYQAGTDVKEYLRGSTAGVPNREIVFEEMVMLRLANTNPAFEPFMELFDDTELAETTVYTEMMEELHTFFETQPKFGPKN